MFGEGIISNFGGRYLRHMTMEDVECFLKIGERRAFLGVFVSIDCMHWH